MKKHKFRPGDTIRNRLAVPNGYCPPLIWDRETLPENTEMVIDAIIPKVIVVADNPWQDNKLDMLYCRTLNGGHAWVNFVNADRV